MNTSNTIIYLPSDDVGHYRLNVTIVVPQQYDGRGKSTTKTEKLINAVESMSTYRIVALLWGELAHWVKLVKPDVKRSVACGQHIIDISLPEPLDFDGEKLSAELHSLWTRISASGIATYIDCKRHYTSSEILEHCW